MQDLHNLKDEDLQGLPPEAVTALAQQMLQQIQRQAQDIRLKDAKLEKLTFEWLGTMPGSSVRSPRR